MIVDCYGYISTISSATEQLFGYSEELLRGSSLRVLFPDLNSLEGMGICESLAILSGRNPQSYIFDGNL
jgi:hypothetical protein